MHPVSSHSHSSPRSLISDRVREAAVILPCDTASLIREKATVDEEFPGGVTYYGVFDRVPKNLSKRRERTEKGKKALFKSPYFDADFSQEWHNVTVGGGGDTGEGVSIAGRYGSGVLIRENGDRYEGEFKDSVRHGVGMTTAGEGGDCYYGRWVDDKVYGYGRGVLTHATGERYEGEWRDGRRHGIGLMTSLSGDCYHGEWVRGEMEGEGMFIMANKETYEGEWAAGIMQGRGVYTWPNGDLYEGDFAGGLFHGTGSLTLQDGTHYHGEWVRGEKHGRGCLTLANGDRYEGEVRHDEVAGAGVVRVGSTGEQFATRPPQYLHRLLRQMDNSLKNDAGIWDIH